ncbi:unnamed protein product [Closterium sp. Naga37s-1]|nr:unnamed protein product [Closterium sp. Naga37s-1]
MEVMLAPSRRVPHPHPWKKGLKARKDKDKAENVALTAVSGKSSSQQGKAKRGRMEDYYGEEGLSAKRAADEAICLYFAGTRTAERQCENPLFLNMFRAVGAAGMSYVPPKRGFVDGVRLLECKKWVERGLEPITATWSKTGVTVASDMMQDTSGRAQMNIMCINDAGALRPALLQMVVHKDWKEDKGKKVTAQQFEGWVMDGLWWKKAEFFVRVMELPFRVMRRTDSDKKGMMGAIYDIMLQLTEELTALQEGADCRLTEVERDEVQEHLHEHWDGSLTCPLHVAGRILNPANQGDEIFLADVEWTKVMKEWLAHSIFMSSEGGV